MKTKIFVFVLSLFAALGLGAGVSHASEVANSPSSLGEATALSAVAEIDSALQGINFDTPSQKAPAPAKAVLQFLQDSITLAGRDVLAKTAKPEDLFQSEQAARSETARSVSTLFHQEDGAEAGPSTLNKSGDFFDGIWQKLEFVPGVAKMRASDGWQQSDYVRIFASLAIFTIPAFIPGAIVGVAAALAVGVVVAIGIMAISGILGVPLGLLIGVPVGLLGLLLIPLMLLGIPVAVVLGIGTLVFAVLALIMYAGNDYFPTLVGFLDNNTYLDLFIDIIFGDDGPDGIYYLSGFFALGAIGVAFFLLALLLAPLLIIPMGVMGLALILFAIPVGAAMLLLAPVAIPIGIGVAVVAAIVTIPIGAIIGLAIPFIMAILAVVLWKTKAATRPEEELAAKKKASSEPYQLASQDDYALAA